MEEIEIEYGKKKKSALKESAMYGKIEKAAAQLGYKLWRNQNGAYNVGGRWMRSGLVAGASDFVGIGPPPHGKFTAVEVKRPGKKATPEQQRFIDKVLYAGGIAGVVTSVDELIQLLSATK